MDNEKFKILNRELLSCASFICQELLPAGKTVGNQFKCGSILGEPGTSLTVDLETGLWRDWADASMEKSEDLISLYAKAKTISMSDAYRELSSRYSTGAFFHEPSLVNHSGTEEQPIKPPYGKQPDMMHKELGAPIMSWRYVDSAGESLFWIARYNSKSGTRKEIRCWTWAASKKWICKQWPAPRPLYNLDKVAASHGKQVIIVEGEKAAEAASTIVGDKAVVTTWPCGAAAIDKVDWNPLAGKSILIWPDSDSAGIGAANKIAKILISLGCAVKIISPDQDEGWDAADALNEGWTFEKFTSWAKSRAALVSDEEPKKVIVEDLSDPVVTDDHIGNWETWGLDVTKKGTPLMNLANGIRLFTHHPKYAGHVWYDTFHNRYFTDIEGTPRPWEDGDTRDFAAWAQECCGMKSFGENTSFTAMDVYARRNKRNEPKDWMESLKWDGIARVDEFFVRAFTTEDTEYTRAVSRNFWIAMVARVYQPGVKMDNMVILEGAQGIQKSLALQTIGGPWYCEVSQTAGTVDFYLLLQGKFLIEISELASFTKADGTHIKTALSRQEDRFRSPYGKLPEDHKRQCVLVGTTNSQVYLKDHTGNRRFWPISCHGVDLQYIKSSREMLFAEAVARMKAGEEWHIIPEDLARQHQERVRRSDPWESAIAKYVINKTRALPHDIIVEALKMQLDMADLRTQTRIDNIMELLGWRVEVQNGNAADRVWVRRTAVALVQEEIF